MYEKSKEQFNTELFSNPDAEYRGAPFWGWTGKPDEKSIREQISEFRDMGFGGFFMHSRTGLDTEYMGSEFISCVKSCVDQAKKLGISAFLYDEDKWPSGFGGGYVTSDAEYASKYLLFSPVFYENGHISRQFPCHTHLTDSGTLKLLKRFAIVFNGFSIRTCRELSQDDAPHTGEDVWYLYLIISDAQSWFDGKPYADLLDPNAVERFIECTHEKYAHEFQNEFGMTIPAIFTDEPSLKRYEVPQKNFPFEAGIPYSGSMEALFSRLNGTCIADAVPHIVFSGENRCARERYLYFRVLSRCFAENYTGQIGKWCEAHGLMLTGHMQDEESLELQSKAGAEVMELLSNLSIPGVDILADRHEILTMKQAQSVAHQFGKAAVAAELYGVTSWEYDFARHKHLGDWAAAFGVTLRIHHLAWMSMAGEMKRDFPASLNHYSPWYEKYRFIEDHFARVCTAMTRGRPAVNLAVVQPIESIWLYMGQSPDESALRKSIEAEYIELCDWLLSYVPGYDILSESLLAELDTSAENGSLKIGEMEYKAVIIPGLATLRVSTVELLSRFADNGGTVFLCGNAPKYIEGSTSSRLDELVSKCICIAHEKRPVLRAVDFLSDVHIQSATDSFICQLRNEGDEKWLFVAHNKYTEQPFEDIDIYISGNYAVFLCESLNGKVSELPAEFKNGSTVIKHRLFADDSLLLHLVPGMPAYYPAGGSKASVCPVNVPHKAHISLAEENVLVLDRAQYRINNGALQPANDILKIDDAIRDELGLIRRGMKFPQPWLIRDKSCRDTVELRLSFDSEIAQSVSVAGEFPDDAFVSLNGESLERDGESFYIDKAIRRYGPCTIRAGKNELVVRIPFGICTNLENVYILGSFGVEIRGMQAVIVPLPGHAEYSSVVTQGLAFYSGNIEYSFSIVTSKSNVKITVPKYNGALITVFLDEKPQDVFLRPYEAEFTDVRPGKHDVKLLLYGNRMNTFGPLHSMGMNRSYITPWSFRTKGEEWCDGYCLSDFGITSAPEICEFD